MKTLIRTVLVVLFIAGGVVAIEFKKQEVRDTRATVVKTILSELLDNGAPVKTHKVERGDFPVRKKISITPCERDFCFSVSRNELREIKMGSAVYESAGAEPIGKIVDVAGRASLSTGLYQVRVKMNKAFHDRKRVVADIAVGRRKNVVMVPRSAVVYENGVSNVYTINEQGDAVLTPVNLGETNGVEYWLRSGVTEGQSIVTEGETLIARFKKINVNTEEAGS